MRHHALSTLVAASFVLVSAQANAQTWGDFDIDLDLDISQELSEGMGDAALVAATALAGVAAGGLVAGQLVYGLGSRETPKWFSTTELLVGAVLVAGGTALSVSNWKKLPRDREAWKGTAGVSALIFGSWFIAHGLFTAVANRKPPTPRSYRWYAEAASAPSSTPTVSVAPTRGGAMGALTWNL